jgi:two-component system, OmpR family, alkaline phosphatase synthesis response regulator PhoP
MNRVIKIEPDPESRKVCIVEDDAFIQEIYKTELEKNGFRVFIAPDGEAGLELIKKEMPAIALVDIMMPKVTGLELLKTLKKDERLSKIPVIMLTNLSDEKSVTKAEDAAYYLVKANFKPNDVVRIVREVLNR